MKDELRDYLKKWLIKANNDLTVAQHELQHENPITDVVCFHCQQAVEKFLKAFLIFKSIEPGRIHDIDYLLKRCCDIDPDFCNRDLKDLNFFGVAIRYPDDFYIPGEVETQEYVKIAKGIKHIVEAKMKDILTEGERPPE